MDGAVLTTEEFAFLLGSVGASEIVDLDDPELFPTTQGKQRKTFEQGLEQLVENGWVETDSQDPARAGLNATLFQLVAIIAAPNFVLSTSLRVTDGKPLRLLHYLGNETIVELDVPAEERYQIGLVGDLDQLGERLAQFLGLADSGKAGLASLAADAAGELKAKAQAGDIEEAAEGFANAEFPDKQATALAGALAAGARADIVGARVQGTEVVEAVKATVFGEGRSAWLAFRADVSSQEISFGPANSANIEEMVSSWMANLRMETPAV